MTIAPESVQLPPAMSTLAADVDDTYSFLYWLSVVLFVGIISTAAYFVWKYKAKPGVQAEPTGHNLPLEIAWTVAPVFVLVYLFIAGFRGYMYQAVAPVGAIEIRARGFQWGWDFEYSNGAHTSELRIPVGKPVKMVLSSNDVLHSFYIPAFRVKRDLVPGMYTSIWFQATETTPPGQGIDLFCAEYCGGRSGETSQSGHWSMITKVNVENVESFDKFIKEGAQKPEGVTDEDWGRQIAQGKACFGCHSVDGAAGSGPTWKGVFGRHESITGGTAVDVDENYIRESILEPQAKIVQGFGPVMPTYKGILSDKDIDYIIKYMKSLK
jgi:cytochrome c oxidase subunit 2